VVSWESLDSKYVRIMHKGKMLAVAQPPKHSQMFKYETVLP